MVATLLEYSYTFITIAFLVCTLKKSLTTYTTLKKPALLWVIYGVMFNLYSLSWLYTVYPIAWLPQGAMQFLGITLIHIITSIVAGLGFCVVGVTLYYLHHYKKTAAHYAPFLFALSLSLSEIIRSLLLSTLFAGNGGTIGLHWGAGTLGNALSTVPLIEYAYFGGVYMLTFILGYLVYSFISHKHRTQHWKHAIGILIGLYSVHYFVPVTEPTKPITVGIITTDFPTPPPQASQKEISNIFTKNREVARELSQTLVTKKPDIIVYPEDTRYLRGLTARTNTDLLALFRDTLFIDGDTQQIEGGEHSNVSLLYEASTHKVTTKNKSFLFPFNEYVPTLFTFLFFPFVGEGNYTSYKKNHSYYVPQRGPSVVVFNGLTVGTLICSEVLSFQTVENLKREHPSIIFYQAHLNVFHNNPWFIMHMRSFIKIAAAQTRTLIISSTNGAPSYSVSPYGTFLTKESHGFSAKAYTFSPKSTVEEK
jgi:apolipoprotein N-acyltransferase